MYIRDLITFHQGDGKGRCPTVVLKEGMVVGADLQGSIWGLTVLQRLAGRSCRGRAVGDKACAQLRATRRIKL